MNPMFIQQLKSEMNGPELGANLANDNRLNQDNADALKKNKGKPNLHLNLSNPEEIARVHHMHYLFNKNFSNKRLLQMKIL